MMRQICVRYASDKSECWAEFYWEKQLEGELTDKEEKELQKLEKENMEAIEEVYQSLLSDQKIKELIERIKSHEWVRVRIKFSQRG